METIVWSLFLIATLMNIYIQSCWFYWWLAMPSFGMRGLVLCALPAVASIFRLANWLQQADKSSLRIRKVSPRSTFLIQQLKRVLWLAVIACSFWGWLHLCAGPTNCVNVADLAAVLLLELMSWISIDSLIAIAFAVGTLRVANVISKRRIPLPVSMLILSMSAFTIRSLIRTSPNMVFVATITLAWMFLFNLLNRRQARVERALASSMTGASLLMLLFFLNLWSATSHQLAKSQNTDSPPSNFASHNSLVFNWPDACQAYKTLQQVPRLIKQEERLREFFARNFDRKFLEQNLPVKPVENDTHLTVSQSASFFEKRVD